MKTQNTIRTWPDLTLKKPTSKHFRNRHAFKTTCWNAQTFCKSAYQLAKYVSVNTCFLHCFWTERYFQFVNTQEESHSGGTVIEAYTTVTLLSTLMTQRWQLPLVWLSTATALCLISLSQHCVHRCLTAVGFLLCIIIIYAKSTHSLLD